MDYHNLPQLPFLAEKQWGPTGLHEKVMHLRKQFQCKILYRAERNLYYRRVEIVCDGCKYRIQLPRQYLETRAPTAEVKITFEGIQSKDSYVELVRFLQQLCT